MKGRTKVISDVKEKISTMDEILEKAKKGVQLTQLESNDLKSYTSKLARRQDKNYDSVYKLYAKARKNTDTNGYAPKVWVGVHLDSSTIESTNREELVNLMSGKIAEDNYGKHEEENA